MTPETQNPDEMESSSEKDWRSVGQIMHLLLIVLATLVILVASQ